MTQPAAYGSSQTKIIIRYVYLRKHEGTFHHYDYEKNVFQVLALYGVL